MNSLRPTVVLSCAAASALLWCSAASARDLTVRSFDGTPIAAHFYGAANVPAGVRVPTVLVGPGYSGVGKTDVGFNDSDVVGLANLRREGYNVMTWDPRGVGSSGGTVQLNSPAFEGRDVQALVDVVAQQQEALLDAPGDPRVGMSGFSYGGAIQLVAAALDHRIDAIVPEGSWHSLVTSLFKDGSARNGWFTLICAGGDAALAAQALLPPGRIDLRLQGASPELKRACLEGVAGGRLSPASRDWFAARGPGDLVGRITAPTLILQGATDALFPLGEAIANFTALRDNDVPVKMMWYCGGHGACLTPNDGDLHIRRAAIAWLARYLKRDAGAATGPTFEWLADDGRWRSGPDYPLASLGTVAARASATIAISPADSAGSGLVTHATPMLTGATLPAPAPPAGSDVLGAPTVRLRYRGVAVPAQTFLYAQLLDARALRVAGVQVTPIPVVLDGRPRTVERELEPIALRTTSRSSYRLQIGGGSNVYGVQRSTGGVALSQVDVTLPLVDATRSTRTPPAAERRLPRRMRLRISSRRAGERSRVVVFSRLRSAPCSGRLRIAIAVAGRTYRATARISRSTCRARAVLRVRARPRSRARISARFHGNAQLLVRRSHSIVRRLR